MKRSKFSLSNYKLFSGKMGRLIPIGLTEVLPGDTVQQSTSALVRTNPLLAPVMHPVHVRIHHWYVPFRIIWDDFQDFITGGPDGLDASVFPTITTPASTGFTEGSLADYMGIPPGVPDEPVSALPFRAYAAIFNEFYRDQDLVTALALSKASGSDSTTSVALALCAWEKDYFTSARPWTQKGPTVSLPLGTEAPIRGAQRTGSSTWSVTDQIFMQSTGNNIPGVAYSDGGGPPDVMKVGGAGSSGVGELKWQQKLQNAASQYSGYNFADLENATAADVNSLRLAMALQRYEEARARYGSRYTEYLRYLGVRSSDARLQRPEYLGGGKQTIQFSEVLSTAETLDSEDEEINPVGALKGHGIGALRSNRYRRFFEEHGYIVTLMSIRPKTMYAQGLARTWNRRTKEDFWQKELQHIGQQEVLNKELYLAHSDPDGAFGYQDRYDEYRRSESSIAGSFRSTLNYWHMARLFSGDPTLNGTFVTCDPTQRNFVDTENDTVLVMANHSIQARRLVAQSGTSFIY